jgi:uncharacterized membrane protein YbhN (UPF0104 family)
VTRAAVWTLVRIGVTIAVLGWVLQGLDGAAALAALRRFTWPTVLVSLVLVAIDRVLMFWRWRLLVQPTTSIGDHHLARIFFISSFLGSFLPAGLGGDAARAFAVGRQTGQGGPALASVVVDRWIGLLAVGLSGCAGLLISLDAVPGAARLVVLIATVVLVTGSLAGLWADQVVNRVMPDALRHTWPGRMAVRLAGALAAYRAHGHVLGRVAILSFTVQALRIVLAWVLGRGLGIDVPFRYYWVFMPINILVILLPISLGGFGLPQGTMIWTLGPLGVEPTAAFLLSTLFVGIGIIGNLPGAWLYLTGPSAPPRPSA